MNKNVDMWTSSKLIQNCHGEQPRRAVAKGTFTFTLSRKVPECRKMAADTCGLCLKMMYTTIPLYNPPQSARKTTRTWSLTNGILWIPDFQTAIGLSPCPSGKLLMTPCNSSFMKLCSWRCPGETIKMLWLCFINTGIIVLQRWKHNMINISQHMYIYIYILKYVYIYI